MSEKQVKQGILPGGCVIIPNGPGGGWPKPRPRPNEPIGPWRPPIDGPFRPPRDGPWLPGRPHPPRDGPFRPPVPM